MKNKKAKFSSLKSTLQLIQQLQAKYFGAVDIDIDMLGHRSIDVWVGNRTDIVSVVFPFNGTAEIIERRYDELLTLINDRL